MAERSTIFRNADPGRARRMAERARATGDPREGLEAARALRAVGDVRQLAFDDGFAYAADKEARGGAEHDVVFTYLKEAKESVRLAAWGEAGASLEFLEGASKWVFHNNASLKNDRRHRDRRAPLLAASLEEAFGRIGGIDVKAAVDAALGVARSGGFGGGSRATVRTGRRGDPDREVIGVVARTRSEHTLELGADKKVVYVEIERDSGVEAIVCLDNDTLNPVDPPALVPPLEEPPLVPAKLGTGWLLRSLAVDGPARHITSNFETSVWTTRMRHWIKPELVRAFPPTHASLIEALEEGRPFHPSESVVKTAARLLERKRVEAGSMFRSDPHSVVYGNYRPDGERLIVHLYLVYDRVLVLVEDYEQRPSRRREVIARWWGDLESFQ